ncbi:MAG: N-methyl-D-aspartate receptor NMDAR2C subunit [Chloroflexota bacterium]
MGDIPLWPRWQRFGQELTWAEPAQRLTTTLLATNSKHSTSQFAEQFAKSFSEKLTETFRIMVDLYGEERRAYHTLEHIEACFAIFDQVRELAQDPLAVEAAIWFHDVIYQIGATDNEWQSAVWAANQLKAATAVLLTSNSLCVNHAFIQKVYDLICATDHKSIPADGDSRLLVDIDLAGLGASSEAYSRYSQQIRQEFQTVPWEEYAQGRTLLLQGFLNRSTIYVTEYFHQQYEEQARANIRAEIEELARSC